MLYRQFASPHRHKEKLAHYTRRIAEQREKVRKLARGDLARGHTGARQLLHSQPVGFSSRRTAFEHARLSFARQRGKSQIAHHTKEPLTKCDIHPPLPLDESYHPHAVSPQVYQAFLNLGRDGLYGKVRFFDQDPAAWLDRIGHFLQDSLAFRQMG